MRSRALVLAGVLAVAANAPAPPATAHGRSLSYSSWEIDESGATVRVRLERLDLTRLPLPVAPRGPLSAPLVDYLSERLRLLRAGRACPRASEPAWRAAPQGWASYEWRVRCPGQGELAIESALLREVAPSHLHFARVRLPEGGVLERVLSEGEAHWPILTPAARSARAESDTEGSAFAAYLALGIEHIAMGWDHLAFVLALLLVAGTFSEVALLVSAFTVAHSVTLALAVLGAVHPEAGAVEALIGFSIALVAAENAWLVGGRGLGIPLAVGVVLMALAGFASLGIGVLAPLALAGLALFSLCHFALLARVERPGRLRAALAFAFGLVHGFGFAGVLAELELPAARLVAALFGFNLGVEIGQLAAVALLWPALRALEPAASGRWHGAVAKVGSAAVCGLGVFWFTARAFG